MMEEDFGLDFWYSLNEDQLLKLKKYINEVKEHKLKTQDDYEYHSYLTFFFARQFNIQEWKRLRDISDEIDMCFEEALAEFIELEWYEEASMIHKALKERGIEFNIDDYRNDGLF